MGHVQGDIIRVTAKMTYDSDIAIQNVWWLRIANDVDLSDAELAEDVCEAIENIYDWFDQYVSDLQTYDSINILNTTQDLAVGDWDWPTLTAGGGANEGLPSGSALLAWFRTGISKLMSKKWLGVFTEAENTDGYWILALRSAVATAIDYWLSDQLVGTYAIYNPGVWSELRSEFHPFISGVVSAYSAYQRRRRKGVGA